MRNMRTGRELERLPPVQNFLASHMPLEKKMSVGLFPILAKEREARTELLVNGGRLCTNMISEVNGAANYRFLTHTGIQT